MIRRITKNNDLKDIIRSIPSDVINNINEVRYYVYGYEDKFIAPAFTQEGDILKVIIPAEDLETLPDGLLYRKCLYNKDDKDYPDGVYNLSITDNLELWIYSKEASVQPPLGSNFLQEDDLKTINGESLVGKGDITIQAIGGVTEEWVTSQGYATETWVSNQGYLTEHQSLADYALKSEIPDVSGYALKTEIPSLTGYATETWVSNQGYLTEHQSLADYALKSEIPSLDGYVQETNLKTINGESIVGEGNIVITGGGSGGPEEVILIPFSIDQVSMTHQELVDNVLNKIDGKPVGSYKIFFVSEDGYYYEADTVSIKHNTSVIGEFGSTVDDTAVYISSLGIQLNFYLKYEGIDFYKDEFASAIDLESLFEQVSTLESRIPDLTGYATETWVESKGYLTEHQSLAGYALKSEIPDVSGYALKTEIPSLDGYVQGSNLKTINGESIVGSGNITIQATGGVTEEWVTSQGYATETWVSNQGYLTKHQSLAGYALKTEIPDVSGYALKTEIPDVSGYALKTEIPDVSGYALKTEIPSLTGYATESWVESKGYLTEHQSLADYALKSEIPSLTGYATETWVTNQGYATQTYVDNKIGQIDTLLDQMLG